MCVCVHVYMCMYELMNMYSRACVPMWAYALAYMCVCNCMCLSMLVVFFLLQGCMLILANAEVIGKCGYVCALEYVCICIYMCMYAYVHVNVHQPKCTCIQHRVLTPSYAH